MFLVFTAILGLFTSTPLRSQRIDELVNRALREWEVPAPMRCMVLADEQFTVTLDLVADLEANFALTAAGAADLTLLAGIRVIGEPRFRQALGARGTVKTRNTCETNVPGVFVAGDASRDAQFVAVATSEGMKAAVAINRALQGAELR